MDKKKLKDIILKTLEKEGGAAGLKALAKASKTSKKDLKPKLNKMSGVKQHKHGDYISTPLSEVKDIIKVMLEDLSSNLNKKRKRKKIDAIEKQIQYMVLKHQLTSQVLQLNVEKE